MRRDDCTCHAIVIVSLLLVLCVETRCSAGYGCRLGACVWAMYGLSRRKVRGFGQTVAASRDLLGPAEGVSVTGLQSLMFHASCWLYSWCAKRFRFNQAVWTL